MAGTGWTEHIIGAIAGALLGWIISSFTKAGRSDLEALQSKIEADLDRLETKLESKMDRQEFRDAVQAIQTQLASINTVLMRRTRDPL
jgi:hypothetical protein